MRLWENGEPEISTIFLKSNLEIFIKSLISNYTLCLTFLCIEIYITITEKIKIKIKI